MRSFKQFLLALVCLPLFAFATNEATSKNVSVGCYGAFKTAFGMLPEIADKINEDQGQELILISNVKTPLGNPSTFTMTIDKIPAPNAEGDYKLFQKHSNNNLYLRLDLMPPDLTDVQLNAFWAWVTKGFEMCPL